MTGIYGEYDYSADEQTPIEGTEDFVSVLHLTTGGYDWSGIGVWYSPSARRFFWYTDSGCSCNSFGDYLRNKSELSDGDRDAMVRAVEDWVGNGSGYDGVGTEAAAQAKDTVRTWQAPA